VKWEPTSNGGPGGTQSEGGAAGRGAGLQVGLGEKREAEPLDRLTVSVRVRHELSHGLVFKLVMDSEAPAQYPQIGCFCRCYRDRGPPHDSDGRRLRKPA
jgi:hypothetical protein